MFAAGHGSRYDATPAAGRITPSALPEPDILMAPNLETGIGTSPVGLINAAPSITPPV
ncbi:MAG: hypothetical protein IPK63_17015 [Candidatus Competibacteraceae bacterium]|nr:hypothetical protein [Candidatus Competibacteraceae bacterium]